MDKPMADLPRELALEFLNFLRERDDGEFELVDKLGLIKFVAEHGKDYPELFNLFELNEEAVVEHFKQTGEVPPGIKLVETTTHEGTNLAEFRVFHGPTSSKS